ncbi:uncharacterized protein METZ01_LOCUS148592, partial [marine metagenome]
MHRQNGWVFTDATFIRNSFTRKSMGFKLRAKII